MNNTLKLPIIGCLFLFLMFNIASAQDNKLEKVKEVQLNYITTKIKIRYDKGKEKWADYMLSATASYLSGAENYLGITFPHNEFIINGMNEVTNPEDGQRVSGYNRGAEIDLDYNLSPEGNPAIIYHEINHCWFMSYGYEDYEWLVEGVSSFLPIALMDSNLLPDKDKSSILETWEFEKGVPEKIKDLPVLKDFRKEGPVYFRFFYNKTFKIQYIIYKELGRENYRQFIIDVQGAYTYNTDTILTSMAKYKNIVWKQFLSGWVFEGNYINYNMDNVKNKVL